jgi:hypothetical protein
MSRLSRLIPVAAVALLLGACSNQITDVPMAPGSARHDAGGNTVGGNAVGTGSGTNTTTSTTTTTTEVAPDTTTRIGGNTVGGN